MAAARSRRCQDKARHPQGRPRTQRNQNLSSVPTHLSQAYAPHRLTRGLGVAPGPPEAWALKPRRRLCGTATAGTAPTASRAVSSRRSPQARASSAHCTQPVTSLVLSPRGRTGEEQSPVSRWPHMALPGNTDHPLGQILSPVLHSTGDKQSPAPQQLVGDVGSGNQNSINIGSGSK